MEPRQRRTRTKTRHLFESGAGDEREQDEDEREQQVMEIVWAVATSSYAISAPSADLQPDGSTAAKRGSPCRCVPGGPRRCVQHEAVSSTSSRFVMYVHLKSKRGAAPSALSPDVRLSGRCQVALHQASPSELSASPSEL
jgi:hypothetical protein